MVSFKRCVFPLLLVLLIPSLLAQDGAWPKPIPCRLAEQAEGRVMVMTLGEVQTPLAAGVFHPQEDRVVLNNGEIIERYYKDILGLPYYKPMDKTHFPLPPSGWCSWYFYYHELDAACIQRNAAWMGDRLKKWGATVCQIDDAWQGSGHGLGENRDWTTVNERFQPGMDQLAAYIRQQGLTPGLWLAPHGQSNPKVVRENPYFIVDEMGKSLSSTWEGLWLLDPTRPGAHEFIYDLFHTLVGWGYDYFKIDGQPIVVNEYKTKADLMHKPPKDPVDAYRQTLFTIRRAIGKDRFLLGCWGIPLEGMGILNGCRTAGDVVQGWDGFFVALDATLKWYFLHNIAWYCDPDVFYVRPPLTPDMARAWATLQGLTGQATLTSDSLADLPASRVNMIRSVMPAADIRPLDLCPLSREKTIWDLKINHAGRSYDVVGCFNWSDSEVRRLRLSWEELGLPADRLFHVYDYWNREYLGSWEQGYFVTVPPAGVRVLTLVPAPDYPVLVSTSRHISQSWPDLKSYKEGPRIPALGGECSVPDDEPYQITFGLPRGNPSYQLANFDFGMPEGSKLRLLSKTIDRGQGFATVTLHIKGEGVIKWEALFRPVDLYTPEPPAPPAPRARLNGFDGKLDLSWRSTYEMVAGYYVEVDGKPMGYAPLSPVTLHLPPGTEAASVAVWGAGLDGRKSKQAARVQVEADFPEELYLSDIEPARVIQDWQALQSDRSVEGENLKIGDRTFEKGLGSHANAEVVYNLVGKYKRFQAWVGPHQHGHSVPDHLLAFVVKGDERVLFESGPMAAGAEPLRLDLDITGVNALRLLVLDGGDGINYDHANWAEARVSR